MQTLYLTRTPTDSQTSGILTMPSGREFYTLEQAWRNNRPFESCIPDGAYLIEPHVSPKHGDCYIVSGGTVGKEKGQRTHILFHPANFVRQLHGCIALGMERRGEGLRKSELAHKLFMQELNGNSAMLFITGIDLFE